MGMGSLGLLDVAVHSFTAVIQGVGVILVVAELPSPYLDVSADRVATLSLLHLCFACRVSGDGDMSPIW